jgi:hypothetical protein
MKGTAYIVIIAITIAALSPITLLTVPVNHAGQPVLGDLNVCRSSTPALSSNGDMPCVNVSPCPQAPPLSIAIFHPSVSRVTLHVMSSEVEQPPRA